MGLFASIRKENDMVKVYGYSDDLVEIEKIDGGKYEYDEIGCYEKNVRLRFADGTVIIIGYCKPNLGVWWIKVEQKGTANQRLTICEDEDADPYSDVFEIDADVAGYEVVDQ